MTGSPLAPPSGSILQFVLASVPVLAVLIYLLYTASVRLDQPCYNVPDEVANDDEALQQYLNDNPVFPIYDMMMLFLVIFILWASLLAYILIFIPKRRNVMEQYIEKGITVLGDVYINDSRPWFARFHDYAYVRYKHPSKARKIVKHIRTYQPYSRETVTVLRLPNKDFSGQPKSDVEIDIASFSDSREQSKQLVWFILAWMLFLLLSCFYFLHQMSLVQEIDDYESTSKGWRGFSIMLLVVTPVVALGGNYLRWKVYCYWLLDRGWVVSDKTEKQEEPSPKHSESGDSSYQLYDDDESGLAMA